MEKWRVGYLPRDGGGDKRGWSLRGHIIYPILSDRGKVLTWIGRDPLFEEKEREWNALPPEQRVAKKGPIKHRFPKGFHRGLELFGQHGSRLKEPGYREIIAGEGILVVEGFNDVIGLDNLGIPAVGICSNRITAKQVEKIAYWAKRLAEGKVSLMFDCEATGDDGAKEALWLLAQRGLDVRLAWSQAMHGGKFAGRQPESITREEWDEAVRQSVER
jgi:DNA primase